MHPIQLTNRPYRNKKENYLTVSGSQGLQICCAYVLYRIFIFGRYMCAGFPRTFSSEELPRDFLINTGPGDPERIGSNLQGRW
jgi:hypothetical protein